MSTPALRLQALPGRAALTAHQPESVSYALLKVLPAPRAHAPMPLNLVVLVEAGALMHGERRLEGVQQALAGLCEALGPEDSVSLVIYGEHAKVLMPAETGAGAKLKRVASFIDSHAVGPGASLSEGLKAAGLELRKHAGAGVASRVLLVTASPIRQEPETERLARQLLGSGAGLVVFGLEDDWNAVLLARLADAGPGAIYHVPRAQHLPFYMRQALEPLRRLTLSQARLHLRLARGVSLRRIFQVFPSVAHWLPGQPTERDAVLELGELSDDRPLLVLLELVAPGREPGQMRLAQAELAYSAARPTPAAGRAEPAELLVSYGAAPGPLHREVAHFIDRMQAYTLIERALEARRQGQGERTAQLLGSALRAAQQAGLAALVGDLEVALASMQVLGVLPERQAKALFFEARQPAAQG